jgi:glutaminyl-tRNA synthetase
VDSAPDRLVFNRIVTLRDTWSRTVREEAEGGRGTRTRGKEAKGANGAKGAKEKGVRKQPTRGRRKGPGGPPAEGGVLLEGGTEGGAEGGRPAVPPQVQARADALQAAFGISEVDAEILARDPILDRFYRDAVDAFPGSGGDPEPPPVRERAGPVANWIIHELPPVQEDRPLEALPFGAVELARLVALVEAGTVSSSGGKAVLEVLAREGGDPEEIVGRLDLVQLRDESALVPIVEKLLEAEPGKVEAYRKGKTGLLGFFMGQVMRATDGKADPELVKALLRARLD